MIKVSRSLRELSYKSLQAREKLTRILGREPTLKELSEELQIDCEEIVQAMESSVEVESIYKPIHQKEGSEILLMDKLEEKDRQEEKVLDRIVLKEVLETLEAKERTIIYLRYFAGKTQAEIGKKMGMSQVQVSRTEKKVLEETGLSVHCKKLIAVQDWRRHNRLNCPYGIMKFFVLCEYDSGEFKENIETTETRLFDRNVLPDNLADEKTTAEQIRLCFEYYDNPHKETCLE